MRTWRADRHGLDEADRLAAGGRAGPGSPGLDHLLAALRAPAASGERGGEQAAAAALAAERRRAAETTRRRERMPASTRTIVVSIATALAVLGLAGTAVAAGTGHLPAGVQQRAHRLFSALGVPAPRTVPASPSPSAGKATTAPVKPTSRPSPSPAATATIAVPAEQLAWCADWQEAAAGGHPMNGRDRRDLTAAAGGEDNVEQYCAGLTSAAPSPTPTATTTAPGKSGSHRATPSHPNPHATSHPGGKK
ncbi:hypothetical protein ACQPZX_27170 [Actinoplanes sp. CA-142083]|uniref:hypothetical protein n=1 Tax=Actinoplanes sp. CA-142083 TaxID=3239903 RepID=UPI003D8BF09F